MRLFAPWLLCLSLSAAESPEMARIERHGGYSTLAAHTFRPMDAIATALESSFKISIGAEDPLFLFRGDMLDISREITRVRKGTLVPARWGFSVDFPVNADGAPVDPIGLLRGIVAQANAHSEFGYRLDEGNGAFSFVPTRTHDAQGRSVSMTPMLDREVTISAGQRQILESARFMAQDLSRQTGLHMSCCQSSIAGYPWGMQTMPFEANREAARTVLRRLGLNYWHMRCDASYCFIDLR